MLPRAVRSALFVAEVAAVATLVRSVAYDRWITVLASLLLLGGAVAASRGRAWGIALALASAAAFPVAWAIGIAPAWFCVVGIAGALPFALTSRAFARFDRAATALLVALAAAGGALGAWTWKQIAWPVFDAMPSLRPSLDAHHGAEVAVIVAAAFVGFVLAARRGDAGEATLGAGTSARVRVRVRVPSGARVATESVRADRDANAATRDDELDPRAQAGGDAARHYPR